MLIGIDASRAVTDAPTGTENYSQRLIGALLAAPSGHRFRLYARSAPPRGLFPSTANYDVRVIPFPRLWTHMRLSAEMAFHAPGALFVPSHVLPLIRPRRSMVTVHDLGYLYFPEAHTAFDRRYLNWSTRWNATAATRVIADSEATREDLIEYYHVKPDKIAVVYPGLNAEWLERRVTPGEIERVKRTYQTGDDYILSVGTIQPRKNYGRLIEAFTRIPPPHRLVIAGKRGWLAAPVFEQVRLQNLGERVCFLHYVPASDLPALYAGARLFVMPSLYEGFGFPVLEAQASGVPVACSNVSSLPEVAGEAAELFDPLNVEAMAHAIRRLLQDDRRRAELIEQGRENARRFSWERAAGQVLALLD